MIYYAKTSCMIDGHSYNAGEIIPEAVIKSTGAQVMHLVRKEGEPLEVPTAKAALSVSATKEVNEEKDEEEDADLPTPTQASDEVVTPTATTTADTTPVTPSTTTPAPTPDAAKDATKKSGK